MFDFFCYFLMAFFNFFCFFFGVFWSQKRSKKRSIGVFIALSLIIFKAVLNSEPLLEVRLLPWEAYLYLQNYWLYPPCFLFLGLIIPLFKVRWNRFLLYVLVFVFFLISLWTENWLIVSLPYENSTRQAGEDHHCRQTTLYTCVPAACVSLLSYYEILATEGEMISFCLTRSNGTSLINLYRGLYLKLKKLPFQVKILDIRLEELIQLKDPVMLVGGAHAIVVLFQKEQVLLLDPKMLQPIQISLEIFRKGDFFNGYAIGVFPKSQ